MRSSWMFSALKPMTTVFIKTKEEEKQSQRKGDIR